MAGKTSKIRSREGGEFDCYLAAPAEGGKAPAMIIASAIHGVDHDICALADEFASKGYIAAAPDLFWRSLSGPLAHEDKRAAERAQPRVEKIKAGEADMADTLAWLHSLPRFNGRAAVMGLCYGGPYAILGPKRLGFDAGISCHGSRMLDFIGDLAGITKPVAILWGDEDHVAPPEVVEAYRAAAAPMPNVELHIFKGVRHGFMMPSDAEAFDLKARQFSMARAVALVSALR